MQILIVEVVEHLHQHLQNHHLLHIPRILLHPLQNCYRQLQQVVMHLIAHHYYLLVQWVAPGLISVLVAYVLQQLQHSYRSIRDLVYIPQQITQ